MSCKIYLCFCVKQDKPKIPVRSRIIEQNRVNQNEAGAYFNHDHTWKTVVEPF